MSWWNSLGVQLQQCWPSARASARSSARCESCDKPEDRAYKFPPRAQQLCPPGCCRGAAARVSFDGCATPLPPPIPAGCPPTAEEVPHLDNALRLALQPINCCCRLAAALLPALQDPAVATALGNGGAYRLAAACAWGFGEEAAAALRFVLAMARSSSPVFSPDLLWRALLRGAHDALMSGSLVHCLGGRFSSREPLPYTKAVQATLCKPERVLRLLDVVAEIVAAADEASGAVGPVSYPCAAGMLAAAAGWAATQGALVHMRTWHRPLPVLRGWRSRL